MDDILEIIDRAYFNKTLACSRGSKKEAAKLLGLTFRWFRYRLEKLGLGSEKQNLQISYQFKPTALSESVKIKDVTPYP